MSSSTESFQGSWLRHNVWMICLPSSTNGETNPISYIELTIESILYFVWGLFLKFTSKPKLSSSIFQWIPRAISVRKVPSLEDLSFSPIQGWIPKTPCYCSQFLLLLTNFVSQNSPSAHIAVTSFITLIAVFISPKSICYFFTIFSFMFSCCSSHCLVTTTWQ